MVRPPISVVFSSELWPWFSQATWKGSAAAELQRAAVLERRRRAKWGGSEGHGGWGQVEDHDWGQEGLDGEGIDDIWYTYTYIYILNFYYILYIIYYILNIKYYILYIIYHILYIILYIFIMYDILYYIIFILIFILYYIIYYIILYYIMLYYVYYIIWYYIILY